MMVTGSDRVIETTRLETLSDQEVVDRVRAGETALFEVLMRRYNQRLYRVARGIVKDESEAEDVMQAAYVNAYVHLDQFAERAAFSTWLTKIAVYEALARVRKWARTDQLETSGDADEASMILTSRERDPEQEAGRREVRSLLEAAVDTLPIGYRAVFVFREIQELSTAETAECLGISEEAVKTRLHRARALLREALYERVGAATTESFAFHLSRCDRVVKGVFDRLNRLELDAALPRH